MPGYGFDELLRDLTGGAIDITGDKPKPKTPAKPAPTQAAPTKPQSTTPTAQQRRADPNAVYDVVLGHGAYGKPAKPLSQMTVGEAIQFGRNVLIPNSRAAGVGRDSRGLVGSSAMGAYQITQETLQRYGPRVLGKDWQKMLFGRATQEKLAQAIFEDSRHGNLKAVWAGLPDSRPGAYAHMPWSQVRGIIQQYESRGGGGNGGTRMAGNQNSGTGTGVTPRGNYERWLQSALPPEVAASTGVTLPEGAAEVITQAPEKIAQAQIGVDQQLNDMDTRISVLDAVTQAAQSVQKAQKEQQVGDSRAINQEIIAATAELKGKVMPVMQARDRVAGQLDEIATMNPLERSLRGLFDLNYDQNFLRGQLEQFENTMRARMYDYQYLDTLQGVALREIDRRYGIETALTDLDVQQGAEDLALVNQRLALATQTLGARKEELQTQSQLIVAQAQARDDLLSRLDMPTTLSLMNQAEANGGTVKHEGIEFSYKELRNQVQVGEQQERTIRSHQMALAQGEINLAEGIATDLVRSMSREQLESAAANGGVWNGIQLPQDAVTQALEGHRQRAQGQAQDVLNRMPAAISEGAAANALNSMSALFYRSKNMLNKSDLATVATSMTEGASLIRQLMDNNKTGGPPEVTQALLMKIQKSQEDYQKMVSQAITRSVGGDKKAAGYVESFIYGAPMTPGVSSEALTYFALKGGLPDGLQVSPEAMQVFVRAQQIANENRIGPDNKPVSFEKLTQIVQKGLTDYTAQVVGQPRLDDAIRSLPDHAKAMGHPFGNMNRDWWRRTYTDAQTYAQSEIANLIKTTPDNVRKMTQRMAPLDSTKQSQDLFKAFIDQSGQFNALEQTYILDKLDSQNPMVPGRANSELFEELLFNPAFHQRVNGTVRAIEGNSFGDFIVGPMAKGAGQQALIDYGRSIGEAASTSRVRDIQAAREVSRGWGFNPAARAVTVLSMIPQVGPAGAEKLKPFIQQIANQPSGDPRQNAMLLGGSDTGSRGRELWGEQQEARILETLRTTKFDDPSLEAYRKAAVANWREYSEISDRVIQGFTQATKR